MSNLNQQWKNRTVTAFWINPTTNTKVCSRRRKKRTKKRKETKCEIFTPDSWRRLSTPSSTRSTRKNWRKSGDQLQEKSYLLNKESWTTFSRKWSPLTILWKTSTITWIIRKEMKKKGPWRRSSIILWSGLSIEGTPSASWPQTNANTRSCISGVRTCWDIFRTSSQGKLNPKLQYVLVKTQGQYDLNQNILSNKFLM